MIGIRETVGDKVDITHNISVFGKIISGGFFVQVIPFAAGDKR